MASAFEELGVCPELIEAVGKLGWTLPTPIQAEAIPLILGGGDVMAAAETGSGKTGAFALPVLQIVHEVLVAKALGKAPPVPGASKAAAAGSSGERRCVLNAEDRDPILAISPDGLRCQARSEASWGGGRATVGAFAGRVYYEAIVADEGLCRVGWSSQAASLDVGTDKLSFGFGGTGKKSHARKFEDYGEPFGLNDTVGCLLDWEAGSVSFTRNGQPLGEAFKLPPHMAGEALYPAMVMKNAELAVNFGDAPFRHPPPPGFVGLSAAPPAATAVWRDKGAAAAATAVFGRRPLAIILEPARDLAEQVDDNLTSFRACLPAPAPRNELFVGGVSAAAQAKALLEGVDIVVGTPGRVMDFIEQGKLPVDAIQFFVLDEADRLLDTGNADAILKMFNRLPKAGAGTARLQVLMFSATLHSPEVRALAGKICQTPTVVDLKGKDAVPETVDHLLVSVDPREDGSWLQSTPATFSDNAHALDAAPGGRVAPGTSPEALSEGTKRLKQRLLARLADALGMEQALVFCRTNFDCDNLERFLLGLGGGGGGAAFRGKRETGKEHPYSCVVLGGARSMDERRAALAAFKEGDVRFLIATDVAARGLDIQGLPYVVNMTLPDRSEDYIHRVGRVGRADTMGLAVSLVSTVPERVWYCSQKGYKPWLDPTAADVAAHTIWYNEQELLRDIEARLSRPIPALPADLALPPEMAARLGSSGGAGGERYGGQRGGGGAGVETSHRVEAVRPTVAELARLEHAAQESFYLLKRKWAAV